MPSPTLLAPPVGTNSRLDTSRMGCFASARHGCRAGDLCPQLGVTWSTVSGGRLEVLPKSCARMGFLKTLSIAWIFSGALLLTAPPLQALAAPTYSVGSNLDAHKDGAFPAADCRSTLPPDHPCTLRAAIETANTA